MRDLPSWVNENLLQWAAENQVSAGAYEVLFINGGYYLYKKRTASDSSHTYIGSIKEDGFHAVKSHRQQPRRPRTSQKSKNAVSTQDMILQTMPQALSSRSAYEYGFSRTVIELVNRNPKWKEFYHEDADMVLMGVIQQISSQSFTKLYFVQPDKMKHPLGYARRLLNNWLPVKLEAIMANVGDLSIFQNSDSTFELSCIQDKHRQFLNQYNISLEEKINA